VQLHSKVKEKNIKQACHSITLSIQDTFNSAVLKK